MKGSIQNIVGRLILDVKNRGDKALVDTTRRYDGISLRPSQFRVSAGEMKAAYASLDRSDRAVLTRCAARIADFHREEMKRVSKSWYIKKNGVGLGQKSTPVQSVGIYVPGGRFSYPSTLLMTAIPAKIAGVPRRVVVTPPGRLTPEILAAADMAGVTEMYRVGGPAAVVALALGTDSIPKVDLIVGPGNALVTEAKRQLFGTVGIDLLAGPSELVILADKSAPVSSVAADLSAQAEHDPQAKGILISLSRSLMREVKQAMSKDLRGRCAFYWANNIKTALALANRFSGEHVELMIRNPRRYLPCLLNGGAVFLNQWSPAVLGDYWAGPSHVLPTGRSARFSSGLSVLTFLKRSSVIEVTKEAFQREARTVQRMAAMEGLRFHEQAISIRTDIVKKESK